jgi:hypothetical protein
MNWRDFITALQASHFGRPQELAKIDRATRQIREGLEVLASLGHHFYLAKGTGEASSEWPRVMFSLQSAPNGRVIDGPWEYSQLGPGWFDTLEEAQHADGHQQSFTGRSGAQRAGLPVIVIPQENAVARATARQEHRKRTRAKVLKEAQK